jgi:hypothetical protein
VSPTLLILAGGMGSRYGGLKQLDRFGPSGETIMDYALYDALAAGFDKVVFLIRHDFEAEFRAVVGRKYEGRVAVAYAFQELDELPPGFTVPPGRTKPWGTTHAIWCARHAIAEPFVSINADDYYGRSAFVAVAGHLRRPDIAGPVPEYCMVGYPVLQTLSEHGGVTRALCQVDDQGLLLGLDERTKVERAGATGRYLDESGRVCALRGDEVVSMNMFGFTPAAFAQLERHLASFLAAERQHPNDAESVIPVVVDRILKEKSARMRVLPTHDAWFGVTHAQDKPGVMATLARMVEQGAYPSPIWSNR